MHCSCVAPCGCATARSGAKSMRRSADVEKWLVALERSDDGGCAHADYAVETTHLDAPHGGPFEVFLSARPQDAAPEAQQTESPASGGSNLQVLLELSSSDSESDNESGCPSIPTEQAVVDLPKAAELDGPRTPRYERKWWRDPLPRQFIRRRAAASPTATSRARTGNSDAIDLVHVRWARGCVQP